jgi:hypothetical protein
LEKQQTSRSKKLFSVPIYFRTKEEHRQYFEVKWLKYLQQRLEHFERFGKQVTDKDKKQWDLDFKHTYFHFWKYTEIIGYVEFRKKDDALYAFVILAETDKFAPIINKKSFRIFEECKPYKITLQNKQNQQIVNDIYISLKQINNCCERLKKYYIDTSEIENFVHLIDFHKI